MKSRTVAIVLGAGVALAFAGRALVRGPAPDAPPLPPSLPKPRATVAVYDDGRPAADRWVVFHDAAGNVTSTARTDKDGKVSGTVTSGSMVTVGYGTSIRHLVTVMGVEPNDAIVIGEEEDEGGADTSICRTAVSLPGKRANAARYEVALGVGPAEADPAKPLRLSVVERFVRDGRFQVLAEAFDTAGEPLAFSHAWGTGCSKDAGAAVEVRLPPWSEDYRPFVVSVSPSEAGAGAAKVEARMSIDLGGPGDRFDRGRKEADLRGPTTLHFLVPRPLGTRAKLKATFAYEGSPDRSVLEDRRRDMPEDVTLDPAEALLPRVSDAVVDGAGGARPSVRWRIAREHAKADAVVARLTWPKTGEHAWTIVAPPDAPPRIALPALPDELAAWRPDAQPITASVALLDASFLDGFADVKKKGLAALEDPPDAERTLLRYSVTGDLDF